MAAFSITASYVDDGMMGKKVEKFIKVGEHYSVLLLDMGQGTAFKLKDDDGILYFRGKCLDDSSFSPLDEFGAAYGCTILEYRNNDGTWSAL